MIMIPPASTRSFLGFNALHFKPSRHHQGAWYINPSPLMPSISVSGYRLCGLFHCFSQKKLQKSSRFRDYCVASCCEYYRLGWPDASSLENPMFQVSVSVLVFMPCTANTHRSFVWEAMIIWVEFFMTIHHTWSDFILWTVKGLLRGIWTLTKDRLMLFSFLA